MQCREVEEVFETEGLGPLTDSVRRHLSECDGCRNLFADLTEIVTCAKQFPAEIEPPTWIWTSLRVQLENEGVIQTHGVPQQQHEAWGHKLTDVFRSRVMATVSVGLLIAVAAVWQVRDQTAMNRFSADQISLPDAGMLNQDEHDLQNMRLASDTAVDASFRKNLAIVDQFIVDCEQRVQKEPQDALAREYLYGAYQQKAELLSAIRERQGSEH